MNGARSPFWEALRVEAHIQAGMGLRAVGKLCHTLTFDRLALGLFEAARAHFEQAITLLEPAR